MAIEKGIPSQLDPEDLAAEVELEVPGSMEPTAMVDMDVEAENMDIEITAEDDGGVTIDFEPIDQRATLFSSCVPVVPKKQKLTFAYND